jgi:TRAP transporter TAXI family solute receptor
VVLYSVEESDGTHFLTMERVEGEPLSELIPAGGLALDRLLTWGVALADAVSAAHDRGITHRDLKPANVMVNRQGRLKILDFGLAKLTDRDAFGEDVTQLETASLTGEGKVLGTVAHMSPEQAEGKAVDGRTDVFALGTILYEMATGERPFVGDSAISILSSILRDTPRPVTEIRTGLPRHLGRIVSRCLEKNPEHRYQSAKDLRNDLAGLERETASGQAGGAGGSAAGRAITDRGEAAGADEPGSHRAPTPTPAAAAPAPRSGRRGLWLGLAAVAAIAVAAAWLIGRGPSAPAPAPTHYVFGTSRNVSGTYYPLGRRLAERVQERLAGVTIDVVPSNGSFENATEIDSGRMQLAFMQSDVAFHSVKTDRVLGHRSERIVGLAAIYQEYCHILVRTDSGVESIDDLPGRRIDLDFENSGSNFSNTVLLDHFGIVLAPGDVSHVGSQRANLELLAGTLDASLKWSAAPVPDFVSVLRSGEISLLPIAPAWARGLQSSNPFLLPGQIPAATYPNQPEAVDTVAVKALLVGHRSLPDEFVTRLLDVLFGSVPDMIAAHPRAAEISPETAFRLEDGMSIPLHPAAAAWRR